jgi:hypothetical protein
MTITSADEAGSTPPPETASESPKPIKVQVEAARLATCCAMVQAREVWSFSASGRWKDWWISCGPEGYRNFIADILDIRPRIAGQNWFCLCGMVEGTDEQFAIGRGCTHRFEKAGRLVLFANDLSCMYRNNYGSVSVTAVRGDGIEPSIADDDPSAFEGLTGGWRLIRRTFEKTRGVGTLAILVLGACLILATLTQGRDLIRAVGDDSLDAPKPQLFAFVLGLLFLGIQSWLWPRLLIDFNYGMDRSRWRPRRLLEVGPRILGIAPFILVLIALWFSPQTGFGLPAILVIVAVLFLILLINRQDWTKDSARAAAAQARFARWWVIVCLLLAPLLMAFASVAPVAFGHALGAPAVVFIGLGLIIPPMIIAIQTGGGLRLPIVSGMLLAAALFSLILWMDNHSVGRRAFGRGGDPIAAAARPSLSEAYAIWRANQPGARNGKLPIVLVASEGGASRAGDWTAEVLGALHEQSGGRLASSLFAISSVSGGSVGAVGYGAFLNVDPMMAPRDLARALPYFAGQDALSPTLAGMLFPDLLQRFLPFPVLPDRAEALERAWEEGWNDSCPAGAGNCKDLLQKPFLTLRPAQGRPWRPILIVNGASEETGRRILTTTVDLRNAIDADDFHWIVQRDVPISTAISNGARFPWISPAGRLTGKDGTHGHIVDGGYFDAAGVRALGELAQAIAAMPERGTDPLHFIFLFIGYDGAIEDSRPKSQQPVHEYLPTAGTTAKMPLSLSPPEVPEQQRNTARLLNEVSAPLMALFASRTAHEAHIMNSFPRTALPADVTAEFIPVMLCKGNENPPFEPPMDWALSNKARSFIHDAVGPEPKAPCSGRNAEAVKKIVDLIAE